MHTAIDDSAPIFTLINTFTVLGENQQALVASLRDFTQNHARFLAGFIAASVHASLDGRRVVNYVQWQTEADLRAMMGTAAAQSHLADVAALATHIDPVIYRVAFVGAR